MFQIFSAVNYCHKNKIFNRGLTIENILISEIKNDLPYIKLGYFGTSFLAKKNAIKIKNVPKIYYEPPEEISLGHKYIDKSDIWSCGVIMYFLLAARPPFGGEKEEERKKNILNENYDLETPPFDKISQECKTLLSRLLMSNPDGRPSAEEVLKDSWFIKNGSKSLFYSISRYLY
jgi:calcium-dependent protein kinase